MTGRDILIPTVCPVWVRGVCPNARGLVFQVQLCFGQIVSGARNLRKSLRRLFEKRKTYLRVLGARRPATRRAMWTTCLAWGAAISYLYISCRPCLAKHGHTLGDASGARARARTRARARAQDTHKSTHTHMSTHAHKHALTPGGEGGGGASSCSSACPCPRPLPTAPAHPGAGAHAERGADAGGRGPRLLAPATRSGELLTQEAT